VLIKVHATAVNRSDAAVRSGKPLLRPGRDGAPAAEVADPRHGGDGAIPALGCLRHADLREGRSILVYGASGSIGTAAVQLSRYFGGHLTAVCTAKSFDLMRSLGTDEVMLEDVLAATRHVESGQKIGNVVLSVAGG